MRLVNIQVNSAEYLLPSRHLMHYLAHQMQILQYSLIKNWTQMYSWNLRM